MIQRYSMHLDPQGAMVNGLRDCFSIPDMRKQITAVRSLLEKHRQQIREWNRSGASGTDTVHKISEMADTLIRIIWDQIEMSVPNNANLVAIIAVGGYGRMELCPKSDLDLLILTSPKPNKKELEQAENIIRWLWDYGFALGSSVRSIKECESASIRDPETWTSFLNERFVAGNHELYRGFVKLMRKPLNPKKTARIIEDKVREREYRKEQLGALIQRLEPNIKEGVGCLRDVHAMMWIARVKHGCRGFMDLVREGLVTPQELEDLRAGYDFLLRVRCCLHFITQKKDDNLGFHIQPQVSEEFGIISEGRQKPEEILMSLFYAHTRTINRITETVISRWLRHPSLVQGPDRLKKHPYFSAIGGVLDLKSQLGNPFIENVELILEFFDLANQENLSFAHHAYLRIIQAISMINPESIDPKPLLKKFLVLCKRPARVGRMLRAMNDVGLISLIVPDFAYIHCHTQHDIYHIYTTDEHTLSVVRQLAYLPRDTDSRVHSIQEAYKEIKDMDVLVLTCIYHDIGKGLGDNHSISGSKLVFKYLKKMGYETERAREAANLVLHHLLMNEIAQRRDLDDPKTIQDFIAKISSVQFLHKLFVLTYCDISSVHPDAWSSWKASLLEKLYRNALDVISSPPGEGAAERQIIQDLVQKVVQKVEREKVYQHFNHLPQQYALNSTPKEVISHLQMIDNLSRQSFQLMVVEKETHWDLTVITVDNAGLLARISGTLAHLELSILTSRIYSRVDAVSIARFFVSAPAKGRFTPESLKERLLQELHRHFRLSRDELIKLQNKFRKLAEKAGDKEPPFPAQVSFSNSLSDFFSTIDLTFKDRIGAFYQINRVLDDLELHVHGAVLTTEADKAMDSFYVTDVYNQKIDDPVLIDKVISLLEQELSV